MNKKYFTSNYSNKKNIILYLFLIGLTSFFIRMVYFPYDIPILKDAQGYFWYALDMSILNNFPNDHEIVNNGWPTILSFFFNFLGEENFIIYQNLQRFVSVSISALTFIPIYFLCKRFVDWRFAIISAAIFAFEPKLILNSLIGTPEPLYIFLISIMLWLFFSKKHYKIYISFFILGLIPLVRYEGLLLLIPISIIYFIRFRKEKKNLIKYIICIGIFILIILPMAYIRNETIGNDGLVSHVSAGASYIQKISEESEFDIQEFIINGIKNLIKLLGWSQIPFYVIFIPLGILIMLKKINFEILTVILVTIAILIPAFYANLRGFEEIKYLLPLYPIFAIASAYSIQKFFEKINKRKLLIIIISAFLIITSIVYVDWKSIDYEHEKDAFLIMMDISKFDMYVNMDMGKNGSEFAYIHWAKIHENSEFPDLKKSFKFKNDIKFDTKYVRIEEITDQSIDEISKFFIAYKNNGNTHLLVDRYNNGGDKTNKHLLIEIFSNEENFPFLEKIYDSKEKGYEYHVKLFKINYNKFEKEI